MSILYYRLLLWIVFASYYHSQIMYRVVYSSALHFMPFIRQHHIFVLTDKPQYYVYTLDFSPFNQKNVSTLVRMLFARNVPGEIRLRQVITNIENDDVIIDTWNKMNRVDARTSWQLSKNIYNTIRNPQIKAIVDKSLQWQPYMNLYNHNCQHFSRFVKNITHS
jgi:hypothetical protein